MREWKTGPADEPSHNFTYRKFTSIRLGASPICLVYHYRHDSTCSYTHGASAMSRCRREQWTHPTKPYKYWTTDMANAKYNFNKEPSHMALPGRGSPHGGGMHKLWE